MNSCLTAMKIFSSKVLIVAVAGCFLFSCMSSTGKKVENPPGYDLQKPKKYSMPDILQEISGIAFHKGDSSIVYAQQDEDGKLFKLPLGTKDDTRTKFAEKGDYEDVSIMDDWALLLKSNGDIYAFPLSETDKTETTIVKQSFNLLPKGEYEGMFADEQSKKVYVLCKSCKVDKGAKETSVYSLDFKPDGTLKLDKSFKINVSKMDNFTGKKKGTFHPSALAIHPISKDWYIVSSVNKALVVLSPSWQLKGAYHLSSNTFNQPEGIAFDRDANLYISNEGSETQVGNILRFDYTTPGKK